MPHDDASPHFQNEIARRAAAKIRLDVQTSLRGSSLRMRQQHGCSCATSVFMHGFVDRRPESICAIPARRCGRLLIAAPSAKPYVPRPPQITGRSGRRQNALTSHAASGRPALPIRRRSRRGEVQKGADSVRLSSHFLLQDYLAASSTTHTTSLSLTHHAHEMRHINALLPDAEVEPTSIPLLVTEGCALINQA